MKDPRFEIVRQQCGTCGGSGNVAMNSPAGFYTWSQQRRRRPSCGDCSGLGFVDIRRKRLDLGWDDPTHPSQERKDTQ